MALVDVIVGQASALPVSHHEEIVKYLATMPVAVVFFVGVLDIVWSLKHRPSVSQRFQSWTGDHPLLAAGVAAVVGALLGHFFLWPVKWPWQ
jgi:hypothetical protein